MCSVLSGYHIDPRDVETVPEEYTLPSFLTLQRAGARLLGLRDICFIKVSRGKASIHLLVALKHDQPAWSVIMTTKPTNEQGCRTADGYISCR
jgi:hypothetical protein